MTTLERMARALCRQDSLGASGSYVDRCWRDWLPDAKAALAALLPLDEGAVQHAHWCGIPAFSGDSFEIDDARAVITAYLKHIGGEA